MSDIDVVTEDLRTSGEAAKTAAQDALDATLEKAISEVDEALPGTHARKASTRLAEEWEVRVRDWAERTRQYGNNLTDAAQDFEDDDGDAASAFQAVLAQVS